MELIRTPENSVCHRFVVSRLTTNSCDEEEVEEAEDGEEEGEKMGKIQRSVFPPLILAACTAAIFWVHPGEGANFRTVRISSLA